MSVAPSDLSKPPKRRASSSVTRDVLPLVQPVIEKMPSWHQRLAYLRAATVRRHTEDERRHFIAECSDIRDALLAERAALAKRLFGIPEKLAVNSRIVDAHRALSSLEAGLNDLRHILGDELSGT